MKLVSRWAMAGALLILAMPMAADAHSWKHFGARNGWRAMASARMAQNPYLAQSASLAQSPYMANANWAAMRAQQAAMGQAYLNNLRAEQMAAYSTYAARSPVPYMSYAPGSAYGGMPYGAPAYGASPLSSLVAPIMSSIIPMPSSSYMPVAQPTYYGSGAGYGPYTQPYPSYLPGSAYGGQIPGRNMGWAPWEHHRSFGSTTAPTLSGGSLTHTGAIGRAVGALPGNFIR